MWIPNRAVSPCLRAIYIFFLIKKKMHKLQFKEDHYCKQDVLIRFAFSLKLISGDEIFI